MCLLQVLDYWNDQIAMFTGLTDHEVVLLVCKSSLDAGEALVISLLSVTHDSNIVLESNNIAQNSRLVHSMQTKFWQSL